jgi:hypothetical protein
MCRRVQVTRVESLPIVPEASADEMLGVLLCVVHGNIVLADTVKPVSNGAGI